MASGLTYYSSNAWINHLFRTTKYTAPSTLYAALFTASPSRSGGGTEVTGGSYARKPVSVADASFDAPSNGVSQNAIAVTFDIPTANWGTIVSMALFDDPSGGNMIAFADLTASKTVNLGDGAPSFPIGDFDINL